MKVFLLFLPFFPIYLVYFYNETLKGVIYESKKSKKAYASDRWKHKVVKIRFVALKASIWDRRRSKNIGYAGGNEIICVI